MPILLQFTVFLPARRFALKKMMKITFFAVECML